jgi:hypothetical protein
MSCFGPGKNCFSLGSRHSQVIEPLASFIKVLKVFLSSISKASQLGSAADHESAAGALTSLSNLHQSILGLPP